jgi:hypothetical protein
MIFALYQFTTMPLKIFLSIAIALHVSFVIAQEEISDKERKHFLSGTFSYGIVPAGSAEDNITDGHLVPAIGFDYLYRVASKWEVGIVADYELATYVIPRKENLKRERAFIVSALTAYNIFPTWSAFAGVGIELEKHKNFAIIRLGTEYSIALKNRWVIPIGIFVDFKEGYESYSVGAGIGRSF